MTFWGIFNHCVLGFHCFVRWPWFLAFSIIAEDGLYWSRVQNLVQQRKGLFPFILVVKHEMTLSASFQLANFSHIHHHGLLCSVPVDCRKSADFGLAIHKSILITEEYLITVHIYILLRFFTRFGRPNQKESFHTHNEHSNESWIYSLPSVQHLLNHLLYMPHETNGVRCCTDWYSILYWTFWLKVIIKNYFLHCEL